MIAKNVLQWLEEHPGSMLHVSAETVELDATELVGLEEDEHRVMLKEFGALGFEETLQQLLSEMQHWEIDGFEHEDEEPLDYIAAPANVAMTYFGLGTTAFKWGERRRVTGTPDVDFDAERFETSTIGYTLLGASVGGVELLARGKVAPLELFSRVSTFPQIAWPRMGPGSPVEFYLQAPAVPLLAPPFSGAFYGRRALK